MSQNITERVLVADLDRLIDQRDRLTAERDRARDLAAALEAEIALMQPVVDAVVEFSVANDARYWCLRVTSSGKALAAIHRYIEATR